MLDMSCEIASYANGKIYFCQYISFCQSISFGQICHELQHNYLTTTMDLVLDTAVLDTKQSICQSCSYAHACSFDYYAITLKLFFSNRLTSTWSGDRLSVQGRSALVGFQAGKTSMTIPCPFIEIPHFAFRQGEIPQRMVFQRSKLNVAMRCLLTEILI